MIRIDLAFDGSGFLHLCTIRGHAGYARKGYDIVCAAVSVLIRTGTKVLSGYPALNVRSGAPERGVFWMEVESPAGGAEFLDAAGTFLKEGFVSIAEEYPEFCTVTITEENRWHENEGEAAQKTGATRIPTVLV
ncbi:hypothetical protein FACS1894164_05230 [Spirochaetia bacterium]|nr:hypothetical protein FACS1894164_05230 [Spirochaetia bacterium]